MQKLFYEFFPVFIFFLIFKTSGNIYWATSALIIISVLQLTYEKFIKKNVEKSRLIGVAFIVIFGGATLLFHDDAFIKWKVTLINLLFALILFGSYFIGKKTIIERLMGSVLDLPKPLWLRLNAFWIVFFLLSAVLNLYFAFYYGPDLSIQERTDAWVNFKFYGLLGLTIVFMVAQVAMLYKYVKIEDDDEELPSQSIQKNSDV